jgi:lipoprotein-releasing system permease protein
VPWYLYLALKQLFPTGRRFPFLTAISILGVTLGVALLVVVTSVMGGFRKEIGHMIVDTQGEVQVRGDGYIPEYPSVLQRIVAVPGVAAATPYATGVVMVQFQDHPAFPLLQGLDLKTVGRVAQISKYVVGGSLEDLDDDSVILAEGLARTIGAGVGDTIQIVSPLFLNKLTNDELFLPREVRVAGLFYIGHQQLDSSTVYCTLHLVQDLYGLGSGVHGINVRLREGENEDRAVARINAALPPGLGLRAYSWMETFADFLWVVNLEKGMMFFLLLFIVIVAAFSVTSSLLISVVRKTREIGLLGALGGRPLHVALCFCAQGLFIGAFGTLFGLASGFGLLAIRNDVVLGIARVLGRQEVLERFYQFNRLPSYTDPADIALVVVLTLVLSTMAGLVPALRAARLKPVEAFRNE